MRLLVKADVLVAYPLILGNGSVKKGVLPGRVLDLMAAELGVC